MVAGRCKTAPAIAGALKLSVNCVLSRRRKTLVRNPWLVPSKSLRLTHTPQTCASTLSSRYNSLFEDNLENQASRCDQPQQHGRELGSCKETPTVVNSMTSKQSPVNTGKCCTGLLVVIFIVEKQLIVSRTRPPTYLATLNSSSSPPPRLQCPISSPSHTSLLRKAPFTIVSLAAARSRLSSEASGVDFGVRVWKVVFSILCPFCYHACRSLSSEESWTKGNSLPVS